MRRFLIAVGLSFVSVIAAGVLYVRSNLISCSTVRECYHSWLAFRSGVSPKEAARANSVFAGFTASRDYVVFPISMQNRDDALLLFDRKSSISKLINLPDRSAFWAPRFSRDGTRLSFIAANSRELQREVISCDVSIWTCKTAYASKDCIQSFDEMQDGRLLLSSSPVSERDGRSRCNRFDLSIVDRTGTAQRITDLKLYELSAINVEYDNRVFFSADSYGIPKGSNCSVIQNCPESRIYSLSLRNDPAASDISKLEPLFIREGESSRPTVSADGSRIAFINSKRNSNPYRYNMMIVTRKNILEEEILVKNFSFSRAEFVGRTVLMNELFAGFFRTTCFDESFRSCGIYDIDHSVQALQALDKITANITN